MRIRASLLLLTGLALLVAPAAGAEVMSEVTFTFHEADTYTFVAQVTFTGENASTYRSNADLDGDQLVSEDEEAAVRGALTDLTEDVNRSDHRLDGGLPETIEVTNMTFQNLTGPVVQGGELVFRTTATYRYAVNASSHELTVARAATGPNATFLVTLLGPPGYQLTNLTGFDLKDGQTTWGHEEASQRFLVTGAPHASYGLGFTPWANETETNTTSQATSDETEGSGEQAGGQADNETGAPSGSEDSASSNTTESSGNTSEPPGEPGASGHGSDEGANATDDGATAPEDPADGTPQPDAGDGDAAGGTDDTPGPGALVMLALLGLAATARKQLG